jgi:hypothetical protein
VSATTTITYRYQGPPQPFAEAVRIEVTVGPGRDYLLAGRDALSHVLYGETGEITADAWRVEDVR